ncbi:nucleoplasmin-like protein ANO39 [Papaver somniferum]|uniref:nucleoplasmin-like protein ANO39 n=1 Tax=Papaver somniferum TaxID=3469 RepID=UPI000E6FC67C|nr:nucleoplasmin-like protein ANO39 [Papaver somniferum]
MTTSSIHCSYDSSSDCSDVSKLEMRISGAEAHAKVTQSLKNTKELIDGTSLDRLRIARDIFLKRKAENEKLATYQQKRRRLRQARLAAEDEVQLRADGVDYDPDVEESEPVWKPLERKIKPYVPDLRAERLTRADLQAKYEEDDYLDVMYGDPEDQLEEVPSDGSDDDHGRETDEDSMEDDDQESEDRSNDSDD